MELNSLYDLKRLEEQIFHYKPNIKSSGKRRYVSDRLRNQLESKAVVKIQRMDAECESLMISLKHRLMLLQDLLLPKKNNDVVLQKKEEMLEENYESKFNLSSESSDDESLSALMPKIDNINKCADSAAAEFSDSSMALALRGKTGARSLSYKSYSSASTHTNANRSQVHSKQENTVTTSGVVYHSEEILVEQEEVDTTPTLHIKIPSLHRGNVHYIVLDSLNFARKIFDYRANEVKQQLQQKPTAHDVKISKQHKKQLKCNPRAPLIQQIAPEEQDLELSQLIQDVMAESCRDETLQATNALESINNNLSDNYDVIENSSFINYSQSSNEFVYSQNSSAGSKVRKKSRKNMKRSNIQEQKEPPKKRGRKPKKKNDDTDTDTEQFQLQQPTKSNLAQYVELFSNDCGLFPGSSTPAASSTRSQPLVSSTTHNFDVVDNISQMHEHQTSPQEPITYYIDGDWANGGPCQLVTTNRVTTDDNQFMQDNNGAVQNYVNCVANVGDSRNNIIATALECNNNLPISNLQPLTNFAVQNKVKNQVSHQIHHQSTVQNALLPIINIQLPPLPNTAGSSDPPPAHIHKDVVDLSVKSKTSDTNISTGPLNFTHQSNISLDTYHLTEDDECLPLDLSKKVPTTIDSQDEDFIRCLIEESDFDYRSEELKKICDDESSVYDHHNSKSLKTAMDMPLLEFGGTGLTSIESNLNFSDQSTEIFNKLLDICPDNQFLQDVSDDFLSNDDLNKSIFVQCQIENSTMLEVDKQATEKNQTNDDAGKVHSTVFGYNHELENTSSNEPSSSTSLAVQLDISDVNSCQINNLKFTKEINLNNGICNHVPLILTRESEVASEVENSKTTSTPNGSDTNTRDKFLDKGSRQDVENVLESTVSKSPLANCKKYLNNIDKCLQTNNPNKSKANNVEIAEIVANTNDIIDINNILPAKENDSTEISPENSHLRSKENVIFSMAITNLREGDNVYNTDSDFGSEKSCDLCEIKTVNNDNNLQAKSVSCNLTNEIASFEDERKGLNLYNNEVEKQQKREQEQLVGATEKVNCSKVNKITLDDKNCDIIHEDLSPLELESKLECPLDFDEDFDDALSLATSFLDSPNDERFEDSIVDSNTTITTGISQELQQNEMCPTSSQTKTLKHFRIPKVNNSLDSVIVSNKPEEMKTEDSSLKNSVTKSPDIEKVTRTVINDLVQCNVISERKYSDYEETTAEKIIFKVFGITCLPFLVDQCDGTADCQLSHKLNDTEQLHRSLNSLNNIHANLAYQILYNHSKLFKMYFNIFCTYYANRNDRTKLLNLARDCERYPECAEFIVAIYEGLVKCGLSRANACRLILKSIRETNVSTSIVEVLVTIIMKSDWTMFTDFIEKYTQDIYQFNFRICILEQMAPAVLNSKGPQLKQVFGKCVQTLHCDDTALLLNSPSLIQCVSLLTTNT